jgi:hypothetical protein
MVFGLGLDVLVSKVWIGQVFVRIGFLGFSRGDLVLCSNRFHWHWITIQRCKSSAVSRNVFDEEGVSPVFWEEVADNWNHIPAKTPAWLPGFQEFTE